MRIAVRCFIQYVPVQPGTTRRAGAPFQCGSGAPFISKRDEGVFIQRALDGQALLKARRGRQHRAVGTLEPDLERAGCNACTLEHIPQPHAAPACIAHGPVTPLHAGHARRKEPAAVARALIDGGDGHRLEVLAQIR